MSGLAARLAGPDTACVPSRDGPRRAGRCAPIGSAGRGVIGGDALPQPDGGQSATREQRNAAENAPLNDDKIYIQPPSITLSVC